MDWLAPSVIATLCGSVVLAFTYGLLYRQYREAYLRIWALSWAIYGLRYVFMLAIVGYGESPLLVIGNQSASLISGMVLLLGTYRFINQDFARGWWYGTAAGIIWIVAAALLDTSFMVLSLPTFMLLALVYIWIGTIFWRHPTPGSSNMITGLIFILWGIHKADYPFLHPVTWFAPWGYLLGALFELLAAIGILLMYFEKVRHDLTGSQERLNAFANALPDLGLVMDHRGMYLDVVTARDELLVAQASELKDHNMHDLLPRDVARTIQEAINCTLQTGVTQIIVYALTVPAGDRWFEARTALMHSTAVHGASNAEGEVLVIARDITERIDAEKALYEAAQHMMALHKQVQSYADTLEQRVDERTADLRQALEQLQRLSHAQDEFVSNVSHELRTPITSLKLRHYLLARHPEQLSEHLAVMERETQRLEHTIEDLLMLSRLDQHEITLDMQPVDLNALAAVYVKDRTPLAREHGLTLHMCCAPDLPLVLADDGLMSQVISIILTNAINYTPPGEAITVSTHLGTGDGQVRAGLSIRDTGLGITPEDQARLFERFFRGKAARESKAQGTGLGLAIAKKIIDEHHGQLEVHSRGIPGDGTTFTMWLNTPSVLAEPTVRADAGRGEASAQRVGEPHGSDSVVA